MNASAERSGFALALILISALVPACAKQAGTKATQPADRDQPASVTAAEPAAADPLVELDQLEARMRSLGLATARADNDFGGARKGEEEADKADDVDESRIVSERQTSPTAAIDREHSGVGEAGEAGPPEQANRCTAVCELNGAICELEVRICSMAKNHGTDPIYADACERAVDDCELSGDACDTCTE